MLEFDGDPQEFEEAYMATFQVSFSDVFGTVHMHDLKEGGESIPVTMENRQVGGGGGGGGGGVGRDGYTV